MVERQHDAPGAESDPLRLTGQGRGEDRRVRGDAPERVEVALREPEAGEAVAVGEAGAIEEQVVLAGLKLGGVVAEKIEAEIDASVQPAGDPRSGRRLRRLRSHGRDRRLGLAVPEPL